MSGRATSLLARGAEAPRASLQVEQPLPQGGAVGIDLGVVTKFTSAADLAAALRRAAAAHGEHEKRLGQRDEAWPEWYAAYMVAEQAGTPPPE